MSYPTFHCEDCERLRNEVEALKGALTAAHDEARAAETRVWNAAIDAAIATMKLMGSANIGMLRKPAP